MKKVALVMLSLKFTKSNPSSTKCNKRPCTSPAHQRRPTSTSKLGPWYFHERDLKWRWSYSYPNSADKELENFNWMLTNFQVNHLYDVQKLCIIFWKILEIKFVDIYIFLFEKLASLISHNDLFNLKQKGPHCPLA